MQISLRALQALQGADVIFYDELVTPQILDRARRDAERVFVGKRRGQPGIGQDEINRRLVEAANAGRNVVRLKGGDPFVFGRGGEELEHLRAANIAVVVVPGITAALGCAAEAGLPLTFRNEATRLSFVTAHRADEAAAIDWSALRDPQTTVVVYMGLAAAAAVRDGLIGAGRDPKTPAGVLARGTRPDAQPWSAWLEQLPALAARAGEGPALLVIGDVVARSDAWREAHLGSSARRSLHDLAAAAEAQDQRSGRDHRQPARRRRRGLSHRSSGGWTHRARPRRGGDHGAGRHRAPVGRRGRRPRRGRSLRGAGRARQGRHASGPAICANASGMRGPTFELPASLGT